MKNCIKIKCNKCGCSFEIDPAAFVYVQRPYCLCCAQPMEPAESNHLKRTIEALQDFPYQIPSANRDEPGSSAIIEQTENQLSTRPLIKTKCCARIGHGKSPPRDREGHQR